MSKTLLSGGLIAGALAGVVVALLQLWLIQPLIIEAVALPLNPRHGAFSGLSCP